MEIAQTISTEALQLINADMAWGYRIVPLENTSSVITFLQDGIAQTKETELKALFGKEIAFHTISEIELSKLLSQHYRKSSSHQSSLSSTDEQFLETLIEEAGFLGSSDIHIERYEERCRVRFRIDGKLLERYVIPVKDYPSLVNKIKIKSGLDIAEKRLPQDGRIRFNQPNLNIDIRVSVLPTLHGEKVVLRLLHQDASKIDIKTLGLSEKEYQHYIDGIIKPNGLVLISGPTGSGKTTTLYATLKYLNKIERNITTVEDPVEYTLEGINQVQLKENIGLGFAESLRTFLRQDPDVIMVGEIRDVDTANMAIRASLTGHLVLSTVHTNSAWGIISRLVDMGLPSYMLSTTLNLAVAQRLVRLLCEHCKKPAIITPSSLPKAFQNMHLDKPVYFEPCGCELCHQTGYQGRKAIYELIPVDAEVANFIKQNESNVSGFLKEKGIATLGENAMRLFNTGKTSLDEIYPLLLIENR